MLSILTICICRKRGTDLYRLSQRGRAAAFPPTLESELFHTRPAGFVGWLFLAQFKDCCPSNIPLCVCITSLFIHLLMDIYVASMSWLL